MGGILAGLPPAAGPPTKRDATGPAGVPVRSLEASDERIRSHSPDGGSETRHRSVWIAHQVYQDYGHCQSARSARGKPARSPARALGSPGERTRRGAQGPMSYERGLQDLGNGLYAYLQPDGGWGWS